MDLSTFQTTYAGTSGTFQSNTTRDITEADMRQFATDISETFLTTSSVRNYSVDANDFIQGVSDLTSAGTVELANGAVFNYSFGNAIGEIRLLCTNADTSSLIGSHGQALQIGSGFKIVLDMRNSVSEASNGTHRFVTQFGLTTILGSLDQNDGCYFRYVDNVNSGNFQCVTASGGTRTTTNTSTAGSTGSYRPFRIEINSTATEVKFYINDALVATHTTNIPAFGLRIFYAIQKTVGNAARYLYSDYYSTLITTTTAR